MLVAMVPSAIHLRASGVGGGYVDPANMSEVASLVGCDPTDMTVLRYGEKAVMFLSKSIQTERSAPVNKSATIAVDRLNGIPVAIRGDVVVFPNGIPGHLRE